MYLIEKELSELIRKRERCLLAGQEDHQKASVERSRSAVLLPALAILFMATAYTPQWDLAVARLKRSQSIGNNVIQNGPIGCPQPSSGSTARQWIRPELGSRYKCRWLRNPGRRAGQSRLFQSRIYSSGNYRGFGQHAVHGCQAKGRPGALVLLSGQDASRGLDEPGEQSHGPHPEK